jgi:hypothetical protein
MPKAWLSIPSARPLEDIIGTLARWSAQGYGIAIWRDKNDDVVKLLQSQYGNGRTLALVGSGEYPGYAVAINALTKAVFNLDPTALFCVAGGDDTLPAPELKADEIVEQLLAHFGGTFGVMQPTGDRWEGGCIDTIAGSPFLGRDWCRRANAGAGPYAPQFTHMFSDEALKYSAEKEGVYLMRRDLTHHHNHFKRVGDVAHELPPPPHLFWCNTSKHWNLMETHFKNYKSTYNQLWRPLSK